jgi:NAD+ diphosphatase
MIHEIDPHNLNNKYVHKRVGKKSVVFSFREEKVLCCKNDEGDVSFPLYEQLKGEQKCVYLFEIDSSDFFIAMQSVIRAIPDFAYESVEIFRNMKPKHLAFAGLTAYHLNRWYRDNEYCGRCGSHFLLHGKKERVLVCEKCGNNIFPRIAPVVIVGVSNGDELLMTKLAHGKYKGFALIAGFIEIGESVEEAIRREVFEEVGIKVKDIRYYKSQPWGFSGSLLLGYYAALDGESDLCIEKSELSKAEWVKRADIVNVPEDFSLTNEMICNFRDGIVDNAKEAKKNAW